MDFFVPLLLLESDVAKFTLPSSLLTRSRESQRDSSATSAILHGKTGASSISKRKKLTILDHFSAKASKLNFDEAAFEIFATSSTEIHDFQSFSSTTPCTADQLPSLPSQMSQKGYEEKPGISHPISRDIGHHYLNVNNLTDEEKYELLTNSSKLVPPRLLYCIPPNSSGRKFQVKWLRAHLH